MNNVDTLESKKYNFLELIPNEKICFNPKTSGLSVHLDSNIFVDLDVCYDQDNNVLYLHISGEPPVKNIIYGK